MKYPDGRILVFTKAPVPGNVKTRMMPDYTPEECAEIHKQLTQHTLQTVTQADLCEVELWCAPDTQHPFFQECKNNYSVSLEKQAGNDLGERMHHALEQTLKETSFAILIGTDCPAIDRDYLQQACEILHSKEKNIVIGPALDGGYVLIAGNRITASVFSDIQWGSNSVLTSTQSNLQGTVLTWVKLQTLTDIDYTKDLKSCYISFKKTPIKQ